MAVTDNFASSILDFNGEVSLSQPTALVWGPDGRLYVTEVDGDVKVLSVAFGDKTPGDSDPTAQFYVTAATTLSEVRDIQNYDDNGAPNNSPNPNNDANKRQITGIDVTKQFNASGEQLFVASDGSLTTDANGGLNPPAVTMYVTSSDSRIGAGGSGADEGLDTNSGVITKLTQTGIDDWDAVDIVRGLPRSEENHATNGLEVVQELDGSGNLVSERLIVASGGNANTGAPSNNFAGQEEQPLSAAILEVDLDAIKALSVNTDANGRQYVVDLVTLDDPTRPNANGITDPNDPGYDGVDAGVDYAGGNDSLNSAKLNYGDIVSIYSSGYRNSYDVEVTEDGRVWTYDNGANNTWGGRPVGEAGGNGGTNGSNDTVDNPQLPGYIATNLNNGEGNTNDDINLINWNPSNSDNFHEVTRSDDLDGRTLSSGGFAQATTYVGPDGKTYVYGGHPNPTRAEGALAGMLFSPGAGTDNAYLLVSSQNSYGTDGGRNPSNLSDYDRVIDFLAGVEANDAEFPDGGTNNIFGAGTGDLTKKVLSVDPGVSYDIYSFADGSGAAVVAGSTAPAGGTLLGQGGLPADIADIVDFRNPIEGDYKEAGRTDGALDSGNGSINGLAEYTSTILDDGTTKMSGAILATVLGGGTLIIMGRNADGTMSSVQSGSGAKAADRETINVAGGPLGISTIGDDHLERGLSQAFQGSIWTAVYNGQGSPNIEILQPNNGAVPLAGSEISDANDADLDGVDKFNDPFELSAENGYALAPGQKITLDFSPTSTAFPNTIGNTGLLGAALDGPGSADGALFQNGVPFHQAGATANDDANSGEYLTDAGDKLPLASQSDGLYDLAGNIIPGGNAPILQIKKVVPGTMVGAENTVRDAMHTGFRPDPDVDRIVMTVTAKNWVAGSPVAADQLTGMVFSDGTQSNFLRLVFGEVNGSPGIEVGYEIDDANYTALAQLALPDLTNVNNDLIDLRLEIDKSEGFAVKAFYRLADGSTIAATPFTEVALNGGAGFTLPTGVLQDVLTGAHTITDGDTTLVSGAAVGVVAETSDGNILEAIDFSNIDIEAFGNELSATNATEVGQSGTSGDDTVIYTGTDTTLDPLAADVENFDGTGSTADWEATGNSLDNRFTLGAGANTITTGTGADQVVGTLATADGTEITDFSEEDAVIIADATLADATNATYAAGSAEVTIGGATITFSGSDFETFDPADGPSTFNFEETPEGLQITLTPDETILYRVNAGNTVAAIDGGPDWIGDNTLTAQGPVAKVGGKPATFSNVQTDAEDEIDFDNVDPLVVPWQLFVDERGQGGLQYNFDVQAGTSYRIDLFYTENWHNIFANAPRIFDVQVEGEIPAAFDDINPLVEAEAFVGQAAPTVNNGPTATEGLFLGVARQAEYVYTAQDDTLTIELVNVVQEAKLNGIQITQLGGTIPAPTDTTAPQIVSIAVSNEQGFVDGTRTATVVLTDETGFDPNDLAQLAPTFTGIVPATVSVPAITLSGDSKTATLVYTLAAPVSGAWPDNAEGQISFATGAFEDAADNGSVATASTFYINPFLSSLVKGQVALAINVGPTTNTTNNALDGADKNTYGGAITNDPIIGIDLEADDPSYYSPSSKTGSNIDGIAGSSGSNLGLDGSALHTYRDSANGSFTATYPIENGVYVVELWFAELFHTTAGNRQGDYTINGEVVALDFDAFTAAGAVDTPTVPLTQTVVVTDGQIVVDVNADTGQPGYNAIVIYEAVDGNLVTAALSGTAIATEGDTASYNVTLNQTPDSEVTVTVDITAGTLDPASLPDDAVLTAGGTQAILTFAAGTTTLTQTFTVDIVDDTLPELDETFTVSISGTPLITMDAVTTTISANDGPVDSFNGVNAPGGDFSDDGLAPTDIGVLTLQPGANTLVATQQGDSAPGGRDRDYVTFTVPVNMVLSELILTNYVPGETGFPQGFIAIDDGPQITLDPTTVAGGAIDLLGGHVYNTGDIGNDILDDLGDGESFGTTFDGFTPPLTAGTYTLWMNQGGASSQLELEFVVTDFPGSLIAIADAPTVVESGDTGFVTLEFLLTSTVADAAVDEIAYTVDGVPATAQNITFINGQATLAIEVPNDDVYTLDPVTVVLTGVTGTDVTLDQTPGATAATGVVTEDELAPAAFGPNDDLDGDGIINATDDDIDGDGALNGDETFVYDATNAGTALTPGQTVRLEFDADGTPFENGLTGALLSPNAAAPEINLDNASVAGGTLNVTATVGDNNNNVNTQENALVAAYTAPQGLSVETRFELPDYDPNTPGDQGSVNFQSSGVVIGTDQNAMVKAVFGRTGPAFELIQDNAGAGNPTSGGGVSALVMGVGQGSWPTGVVAADIGEVAIRLEVFIDAGVPKARAFATFFDINGVVIPNAESFQLSNAAGTISEITLEGALAAQVLSTTPLGAGVMQTSVGAGPDFDVAYQYLEVTSLEEPVQEDIILSISGTPVIEGGDIATTDAIFTLTASDTGLNGDVDLSISTDGSTTTTAQTVTFINGLATISVPVTDDDLANGPETVEVTLVSVTTPGFVIDAGATVATIDVTEDDFAPVAIADTSTTPLDTVLTFNPAANDTDGDDLTGDLTVTAIDTTGVPADVTVELVNGEVTVTPTNGFTGDVTFGYTVADPGGNTDTTGTATVTVAAATNTTIAIAGGTAVESGDVATTDAVFTLSASDIDLNGDVDLSLSTDGGTTTTAQTVTFINGLATISVPVANDDLANGSETVEVTLVAATTPGFVIDVGAGVATVDVTEDDFAPVAISDTPTTPLDTVLTFNPAANDTDGDDLTGDLTVTAIDTTGVPSDVTVELVNGEVTVTPTNGFTGDVTFGYTVADPGGNTDTTGTATVTVTASSDTILSISGGPIVESGDSGATSAVFTLSASDTGLSGAVALSVSTDGGITTIPQAVTFINGVANLSFLFASDDLANGPETVEMTLVAVTTPGFVIDAGAATATIDVTEDDFAPVAVADTLTTPFDTGLTFNPAANDTDGDNLTGDLTVSAIDITGVPADVTVELVNGEVTVTPTNSFIGDVTFGYTVVDPGGNIDTTGTATVTVEGTTIAIAGGTAVESGDVATTDAVFTLSASGSLLNGDIDLSISTDGGLTTTAQTVTFINGVATITVPVANDDLANGPEMVEVTLVSVTTPGFEVDAGAAVATVEITEDDVQALSLTIDPDSIAEDGLTAVGTVTRNTDTTEELIVTLSSDDSSEATVPLTVTIPVGAVSATFDVTIVDDAILDGAQTATITAAASGFLSGTAPLNVIDNDAPATVLRIEAEDITNTTGYRLEGNSAASGGQMLSLVGFGGPETGTATFLFSGASGFYDVVLGTFDEKDGTASFTVQQDGNQIGDTIFLDQNTTGSNAANNSSKVSRTVGTGLELFNGATITITGFEQDNEHARFDFIEFTSAGGGNPTPPTASDDDLTTDEATAISGNVLTNDIGTPPLSVIEVDGAAVGSQITLASGALLTLNGDGSFDYDPNGAFDSLNGGEFGTDSFTYLASNGQGFSEATVTVTINGIDDTTLSIAGASVVELDDTGTTDAVFTLTASDSGLNGDVDLSTSTDGGLTTTAQTVTFTNGVATLIVPVVNDDLANGPEIVEMTLVSTTAPGFGIDAGAASATVEVTEDDFAPEAVADVLLTTVDTAITFNPADNDTDLDNDAADLVVTAVDNINVLATEATVEVLAGQVTVTPLNGFTGDVTFDYTVVDLAGNETIGTATVTVDGGPQDQIVLRINAFGPEVAAIDGGPVWQADNGAGSQYLTTSDNRGDAPPAGYAGTVDAIPAGVPESVLDNARSSNAPFSYNIPVTDLGGAGSFRVNLYVAELFSGGQASAFRIFDASLEGSVPVAFNNITPGTAFGADVGVLSAEVEVTDGVLNIGLLQDAVDGVQNPIVNAIEIVRLGAPIADTEPPSAAIALTNPADADSALLVDITLGDASGIDETSLGADDLTLSIDGTLTAATVSFIGFAGGVASYSIAAPVDGWANGAAVSVNLEDGAILDLASPANASLASSQSLAIDLGAGAEPTNAIEAFAAQDDLDTSATYGNADIGAAVLEIMAGSSNIQGSNFGANSFEVTNVGDKKISAIFIDASTALYQDSVFDPDGKGGDSAAKPWAINDAGNTGGFVTGTGYFLPGQDPLPNNTGIGIASNGGFKGAMVKFNPNVADGFNSGETVGFSGDMDPNSIAGLTKASVDGTAIDSWDVGGISGHELIGSSFTVLFDDGTTATGYLNSDGSASGSQTIATQGSSLLSAPNLVVNGVGAGATGTYGVTQPTVIVSGTPGDVVRLTLSKGFDPVTSGAPSNIDQLVEDRLDRYDFKVNNSFDLQTQDVVIGANGTFDATGLFDYNTAVANNVQDGTFPGDDVAQIAFVAAVIDPSNNDLPLSEVSDPIILTNLGGPVQGAPNPGPSDGFFELQGSGNNVYFKIQIEDPNGGGGANPGGKWNYLTAEDELGNQDNFQGDGYYLFGSETNTSIDNQVGTNELLEYTIFVPETDLGTYTFSFAVSRDGNRGDIPSDQQNDLWLNFKHAEDAGNGDIEEFLSGNGSNEAEPLNSGFIKVFGGPQNGNWGTTSSVDGAPGNFGAQIEITEAGLYTIQIDGRSQGFHVDYFELYKGSNPGSGAANSAFVTTGPQPVVLANAIPDQVFADGVTDIFNLPTGTFDDPNNDPITYQVTVTATNGSDVNGVTINPTTGQITGLSTLAIDTYTVLVTAQTIDGIASDTFEVDIVDEIALETLRIAVNAASDDFEEQGGGGSADLEFGLNGSSPQEVGIRFDGITIPAGAVITNAYIELTADESNAAPASFTIGIQDSENAATFTSPADLLGRQTAGDVAWSNVEPWTVGQTYQTPNLAALIQQVIGADGVSDGALAFLIDGSGSRAAESFGNGTPPNLVIEFGPVGPPVPTVSIAADTNGDEAGLVPGQFTVSLSEVATSETLVTYSVGGTATAGPGADYAALSGSVVIPVGQQSATIIVPVQQDSDIEGDETVVVTLTGASATSGDVELGAVSQASILIEDDEVPNLVTIAATTPASEPDVTGVFTVSLDAIATTDTIISYSVSGTATAGTDYTALGGTVTITAGDTEALILVPALEDNDSEGNETVIVTLDAITQGDANVLFGGNNAATLTLGDDDGPPPAGFTVEAESISNVTVYRLESDADAEGGAMLTLGGGSGNETGTASFTFTGTTGFYDVFVGAFDESDGSPAASLSVALDGTSIGTVVLDQEPGGNAASPDTKVERSVGQALITTGQTITVTGVESGGEQARFDFIRFAPDAPSVPTAFITADANGSEAGLTPGQFTVSLSAVATSETVVTYSVGGTATAGPGADYGALSGSVIIPVGQQSATIAVPVQQDSDIEGIESVIVTLTGVTGSDAVLGSANTATVFIADDEVPPLSTLTFEAEDADSILGDYRTENIGVASDGTVLSFSGGGSNESGSAAFVFGDTPDEVIGNYDIIIGTFDENDGLASFTVDLTDFETGLTTEIGSWELNASLGSNAANAKTFITPTVATNIGLTAGDIITVNGFENSDDHARLDYLQLVPTI